MKAALPKELVLLWIYNVESYSFLCDFQKVITFFADIEMKCNYTSEHITK